MVRDRSIELRIEKPMAEKPRQRHNLAKAASQIVPRAGASLPANDESLSFLGPAQGVDELGRLGHYRILKVLGRGGMGTVFMAEDSRLRRLVALKVMLPSIAKKQVSRDRFKREAEATAAIEHDHIVTIYEVNEDRGVPYLAMQFLKGMTLEDWLKSGKRLNVPQIMRIGKEIAKGLAAAHACHLIHRDIKPSNIWLDAPNKGRVKILDFGLARPAHEDTQLTQEGMVLGTPAYMSPEQARAQNVEARSDLFSLGCVLYRLCAGRLPFAGKDALSMLLAITNDEPEPVHSLNPNVPAGFARLIHQLLAKRREDRFPSAQAVVQAIQGLEKEWVAGLATQTDRVESPVLVPSDSVPKTAITPTDRTFDASLDESAIAEFELRPTHISGFTVGKPPSSWMVWGLAGAFVAVLTIGGCVGFLLFNDRGQVRIQADDELGRTFLRDTGLMLLDHHKIEYVLKEGEEYRLPSGGYQVAPGLPFGLQVKPDTFTLVRGKAIELRIQTKEPIQASLAKPSLEPVTTENARKLQKEWASYLGREVDETNSIHMKLVLIPPGDFTMGSSPSLVKQQVDEAKKSDKLLWRERYMTLARAETPAHGVRITSPFLMGAYEVTVNQFRQFVTAETYVSDMERNKKGGTGLENGLITRKANFNWNVTGFTQHRSHPVSNITWGDAEAFCKWLSKKEHRRYRLPTEAEWEYACRAGATTPWHFGDSPKAGADFMWPYKLNKGISAEVGPHAVGERRSNDFGLYDMHGNVEEMCSDYWAIDYYEKSPKEDPRGPAVESVKPVPLGPGKARPPEPVKEKVARGGSFKEVALARRSAYRNKYDPTLGHVELGLRVVCEISLPPTKK